MSDDTPHPSLVTAFQSYAGFISVVACAMLGWYFVSINTQLVETKTSLRDISIKIAVLENTLGASKSADAILESRLKSIEFNINLILKRIGEGKLDDPRH